jgi:signal transduction histidine kinase
VRVTGLRPEGAIAARPARTPAEPDPAALADCTPGGARLTRKQTFRCWLSFYGWRDLTWLVLWMLGLAAIVMLNSWPVEVPLMAVMFGVMLWHSHRRLAANAERARVSQENARLLAIQRQFLQDAAHQLRTPITIALGHSELLARSLADNQDKRDINVIVGELNRLRVLSERLLLIATSEIPDFLRPEPVSLDQMMLNAIQRWRPTAERHWQLGPLDRIVVQADRERLGLAVDALLENATQHTAAGDAISLSVTAEPGADFVRLAVSDSGSGIAPSEVASIFERFTSGPATTGRRGTGLGLPLVRAVARGHGGDVQVHSQPGSGTTFELFLPFLSGRGGPLAVPPPPVTGARPGRRVPRRISSGLVGTARIGGALRERARPALIRVKAVRPAARTRGSAEGAASPVGRTGHAWMHAGRR